LETTFVIISFVLVTDLSSSTKCPQNIHLSHQVTHSTLRIGEPPPKRAKPSKNDLPLPGNVEEIDFSLVSYV